MQFFKKIALLFVSLFTHTHLSLAGSAEFLTQLEPLNEVRYIATPEDDHQPLYDAFASAKKSIKVGIFSISSPEIVDHLILAKNRGIQITVIADASYLRSTGKVELMEKLKAAGIEVITAAPGFSISHWKMFIIDEQTAFISTMNWVKRTEQMRDMGVFITNPSIIKEILAVYNQDIENAKNKTAITPELTQPNLVWSPINSEDKLIALINSAQSSIDIWIENMGNKNVHAALKSAVERKVKVRILTSICGLGMPASAHHPMLKELSSYGIDVKGEPYPANLIVPYIHAKTITVDLKTAFLGSENFSYNSLIKARELGIIFEDTSVVTKMHELYEKDWSHAVKIPEQIPEKCSALTPSPVVTTEPPVTPTPIPAAE